MSQPPNCWSTCNATQTSDFAANSKPTHPRPSVYTRLTSQSTKGLITVGTFFPLQKTHKPNALLILHTPMPLQFIYCRYKYNIVKQIERYITIKWSYFLFLVKCSSGKKKKMSKTKVVFANYNRIFCPDTAFSTMDSFKVIYSKPGRLHLGPSTYS
jgi:hypothetical protein